jgi:hypothetical protein
MKKDKVFIIITHKHRLKERSKDQWDVVETVEFVDQIRSKHYSYASAIGDYINREVIMGTKMSLTNYIEFDNYVRNRYKAQMDELDSVYAEKVVKVVDAVLTSDRLGNITTELEQV